MRKRKEQGKAVFHLSRRMSGRGGGRGDSVLTSYLPRIYPVFSPYLSRIYSVFTPYKNRSRGKGEAGANR